MDKMSLYQEGKKDQDFYFNKDVQDVKRYIINNRQVINDVVRAAEINSILHRNMSQRPFSMLSSVQKFLYVFNLPVRIAAYLTILPTNEINYSKMRYCINCLLSPLFCSYVLSYRSLIFKTNTPYLIGISTFSVVFSGIIFFILDAKRAPTGKLKYFFYTLGFLTATVWLFYLSDCLISFIISLNVLFNYNYTFMMIGAFSFWAWIPVSLASLKTVTMIKHMPGYGGAAFNGLFVFGLSVVVQDALNGITIAKIWPSYNSRSALQLFLYLVLNFVCLIFTYIMVAMRAKRYTRPLGIVLIGCYLLSVIWTFFYGIWALD